MSLITDKQAELVALNDTLAVQKKELSADENNVDMIMAMGDTMDNIDAISKQLDILDRSEGKAKAMAKPTHHTPAEVVKEFDAEEFIVKSALVTLESFATNISVEEAINKRYGKDEIMKGAGQFMTKGAQNPAMTNVASWAEELVQEGFGAFLDMIAVDSVVAQLPLTRYTFNGYGSLKIPTRTKRYPEDKNLAGAWTKEGDPIRVGAATLGSITLTPKKLGVIGTFTREIFERSTPNIETLIRSFMLEDTSIAIDTLFIGATAATASAPAGILHGVTAITSSGSTPDKIAADLSKAITAMTAAGGGRTPYFIMNPARKMDLAFALNSVGTPAFPELANGTLRNIPIATSLTVPMAEIILVDASAIGIAGGVPQFLASNQATVHEEYVAADVKPIVDGSTAPGVTANPVRSLYQTDSLALRMVIDIDWSVLRDPAASAQVINAIA